MVKLKENMFNGSIFLQSYVLLKLTPDMRNVISLNCVHHVRQNINNSLKPLSELLCAIQNLNLCKFMNKQRCNPRNAMHTITVRVP